MASYQLLLFVICVLVCQSKAYADFGSITKPAAFEPTFTVSRPRFLPDDAFMRYESQYSSITAMAPSVTILGNGMHQTFWSMRYQAQVSQAQWARGVFRRGVFQNDPQLFATCTPCDGGNSGGGNDTAHVSSTCYQATYTGVFDGVSISTTSSIGVCFDTAYSGALRQAYSSTSTGLPCCSTVPESCRARNSSTVFTTFSATTGIFGPSTTSFVTTSTLTPSPSSSVASPEAARTTVITFPSSTVTSVVKPLDGGSSTTTIITSTASTITVTAGNQNPTTPQVTLSVTTITPSPTITNSSATTTLSDTIVGCGTARGCGTVVGSGTVYLAPFGFPAVTSVGTVSGCAPTVIGCGTMIATSGTFTGTGTIYGCGEGTGMATLTGAGTVYPAGFNDRISFVSTGVISGSGRVVGCGTLTGTGTFWVSRPYTTVITPTPRPTVNVFISYCPPPAGYTNDAVLYLGANATATSPANANGLLMNDSHASPRLPYAPSNLTSVHSFPTLNGTDSNTTNSTNHSLDNPLCHICPEDSGICCPLYVSCGTDGHCPYLALEQCGYVRHGVNIVDAKNSSQDMGMMGQSTEERLANGRFEAGDLEAPGLPGSANGTSSEDSDESAANKIRRRWKEMAGYSV